MFDAYLLIHRNIKSISFKLCFRQYSFELGSEAEKVCNEAMLNE